MRLRRVDARSRRSDGPRSVNASGRSSEPTGIAAATRRRSVSHSVSETAVFHSADLPWPGAIADADTGAVTHADACAEPDAIPCAVAVADADTGTHTEATADA